MKILMLGWELPPHNSGGLGVACLNLSKSLAKMGADIDFVVPYEAEHHLDYMHVLSATPMSPDFLYGGGNAYSSSTVEDKNCICPQGRPCSIRDIQRDYCKFVEQYLMHFKPDLVHAHDWLTYEAGILAKKNYGIPLVAHVHAQRRRSSGLSGELEGILPFPRGLAVGRLVAAAEEAPLVYRREAVLGSAVVAVQINIGKDARRRRDRVDAGIERPVTDFRLAVCIRRDIDEPQALRPKAVGRINEHFRVPEAHDPHTVENRVAGEGVAPEAGLRRPDDELAVVGVVGVDAQPRRGDAVRRPGRFVPANERSSRDAEGDAVADIDGSFAVKRNSADGERQASRREFNRAGLQRRRNGGQRAEVRD